MVNVIKRGRKRISSRAGSVRYMPKPKLRGSLGLRNLNYQYPPIYSPQGRRMDWAQLASQGYRLYNTFQAIRHPLGFASRQQLNNRYYDIEMGGGVRDDRRPRPYAYLYN